MQVKFNSLFFIIATKINVYAEKYQTNLLKARLYGQARNSSSVTPSHPISGSKHIGNCSGVGGRPLHICLAANQVAPRST